MHGSGNGWLIAIGFFTFLFGVELVRQVIGWLRDRQRGP